MIFLPQLLFIYAILCIYINIFNMISFFGDFERKNNNYVQCTFVFYLKPYHFVRGDIAITQYLQTLDKSAQEKLTMWGELFVKTDQVPILLIAKLYKYLNYVSSV